MVEWQTACAAAGATGFINFVFWFLMRRSIEQLDAQNVALFNQVKNLEEKRVAALEIAQRSEGDKRKLIYESLEQIRIEWMSKKECEKIHAAIAFQSENYMAAVMKLESVSAEVSRLVSWVHDINQEQVSIGKDLAAIGADVKNIRKQP